jgi:ribosome-associated heat shock protein Hsp15
VTPEGDRSRAVRIDKWLWAVRVFKTRTAAAQACRHGRVVISGSPVKPSRDVRIDETIAVRLGEITRTLKVLAPLEHRVGAALAPDYVKDLTPASEYQKAREPFLQPLFSRPKGAGRPTKKDRRQIEKLF